MTNKHKRLQDLAEKYGTDKIDHGYIPHLAEFLPDKIKSFLEIGTYRGASARMFDDYYGNKAEIHLIDLFEEDGNLTEREARALNFVSHKGSQSDIEFLCSIKRKFSIISEDASHNSQDQLITFKHAFHNMLESGGLYICEDLHCCTQPFYWGGEVKSFEDTILWMFQNYLETGKIENVYFNAGESEIFQNLIKRVELRDNKIVFVWRN